MTHAGLRIRKWAPWFLVGAACALLCACPPKTKQLGEECYLDCGLAPLLGPALPNCISDCAGDMVCGNSETKWVWLFYVSRRENVCFPTRECHSQSS